MEQTFLTRLGRRIAKRFWYDPATAILTYFGIIGGVFAAAVVIESWVTTKSFQWLNELDVRFPIWLIVLLPLFPLVFHIIGRWRSEFNYDRFDILAYLAARDSEAFILLSSFLWLGRSNLMAACLSLVLWKIMFGIIKGTHGFDIFEIETKGPLRSNGDDNSRISSSDSKTKRQPVPNQD